MSFSELIIKEYYRTSDDDIVNDFLIPTLKMAKLYKRAAGFFSSTALVKLSVGISGLINNGGKMQLVVSPNLSQEDIDAIKLGYEKKEQVVEKVLLSSLDEELSETNKDRLNLMISLIENGILDIKVAVLDYDSDIGMYHEKIGIIEDEVGNKIAFNGSYNESLNSYVNNFESLDVFSTLNMEFSRVNAKINAFEKLWNNNTDKLVIKEFPKAVKEKLFEKYYDKEKVISEEEIIKKERNIRDSFPTMPPNYLRKYQEKAVEEWKKNNFVGIFDMATGTGKTKTGLGAAIELLKEVNNNLAIIIICPYTHLVEQWIEDLEEFNFNPIMGYGSMNNKRWMDKFKDAVLGFKLGTRKYFCFITTNATYTTDKIQNELKKIENKNVLFIADEAHNLGAPLLYSKLNNNFKYRLALSATFERYNDEEGTEKILRYFGNNYCIHYGLKEAIDNNMLTEYKYYPIPVYLNEDELDEYMELTHKIGRYIHKGPNGKIKVSDAAKTLLLKRARLIAGCNEKNSKVIELLKKQKENRNEISNTLIYCGATTVNDNEYIEDSCDTNEIKQIDYLRDKIKKELHISVSKFTSTEDQISRKLIKEQFISKDVNAIVAIKCLDEGVNIPSIHTAYILASSTNPREYVQRRGRVLRLAPNKQYAEIYDFITLPRKLENIYGIPEEILKNDLGLIKRELTRIDEFATEALNFSDSLKLKESIKDTYGFLLNKYEEEIVE